MCPSKQKILDSYREIDMLLTAVKSPKRLVRPYITTLVARFFVFGYGSWKSAEEVSCVFMEESLLFSSSRVKGYFISETFFKLLLNVPIKKIINPFFFNLQYNITYRFSGGMV